jgi:hypothetical protein
MHPAQKLAADADLVERARDIYKQYDAHGCAKSGRLQATFLVRDTLGVGLGQARDWLRAAAPEMF